MTAIARADVGDFHVERKTIGRGGDWRGTLLAWIALRRGAADQADVIHAWDEAGLMAALAIPRKPIIYSPCIIPCRRVLRRLRSIMQYRNVRLVCNSTFERDAAIAAGIDAMRCETIAPAVDSSRLLPPRDSQIRGMLGFTDEDFVLLAPGESTQAAGHRESLWAGSILHVLDRHFKVLIWGRGQTTDACRRLAGKLHQTAVLAIAESKPGRWVEYEQLVSAADAVVYAPRGPTPMLPLMIAREAGLPIVATPAPWIGPELKSAANWLDVPRRSARMMAQRVLKLRNEGGGRREISEKSDAVAHFINQYHRLYRGG